MSAIPLIPTVNSVRRCGSWRIVPYLALDRARCLSTAVVKVSTCQGVKLVKANFHCAAPAASRPVAPRTVSFGRKDPRYPRRFIVRPTSEQSWGVFLRRSSLGMLANVRDGQIEKSGEVSYVAPRSDDIILK